LVRAFFVAILAYSSLAFADPTRPVFTEDNPQSRVVNSTEPTLEALFVTNAGRKAIIIGNIYLEGQQGEGIRVLQVMPEGVKIEYSRNGQWQATTLTLDGSGSILRIPVEETDEAGLTQTRKNKLKTKSKAEHQ
jgi:hypothetical protein